MDRAKSLLRSCGMLAALILIVAVSGALADTIGGRDFDRGTFASSTTGSTSSSSFRYADFHVVSNTPEFSWTSLRFADNHPSGFELSGTFGRNNGVRDGEWFWMDLKNFLDKDTIGTGGGSNPNSVATPEPESLLLLANGLGFLLLSRRRWLKA